MVMNFKAGNTEAGNPTWGLYGGNGELVAYAGETFASEANAKRAAEAFKVGAASARYDVYEQKPGEWRWRAWRSSDKVANGAEPFASKYNAERAYENVRDNARYATGP